MSPLSDSAARKPLFPRGPGPGLRALGALVVGLTLWGLDLQGGRLERVHLWAGTLVRPFTALAEAPYTVADVIGNFETRQELLRENQQLKDERFSLNARLLRFDALEAENRRIRQLLSSSAALDGKVLIAEMLAISQDPFRHQVVLNKGLADGVYKGQAVVDAYGVIGQVIRVQQDTAVVLMVTDPNHSIPVEVNRTGLQTIAIGRSDGQGLSLPYLPKNADVKVGDLLVSSAVGGRFPAGYPVGEVFELREPAGGNFMDALATPSARLNQGRHALLVWNDRLTLDPERLAAEANADPYTPGEALAGGTRPSPPAGLPALPSVGPAAAGAPLATVAPGPAAPRPSTPGTPILSGTETRPGGLASEGPTLVPTLEPLATPAAPAAALGSAGAPGTPGARLPTASTGVVRPVVAPVRKKPRKPRPLPDPAAPAGEAAFYGDPTPAAPPAPAAPEAAPPPPTDATR